MSSAVPLSATIKDYIQHRYSQHPDMFLHDLEAIQTLRYEAITVQEPHVSGIRRLQAYAAQLVWLSGKFPIDIGLEFPWYAPLFGFSPLFRPAPQDQPYPEDPQAYNNLQYELFGVLYNLAALYTHLAVAAPRSTTEGLKTAANYFNQAAGVLTHLQTQVLPDLRIAQPPRDLSPEVLDALTQLCLAQSQECFWQKAVMDGYKDASIAKLAARVSDFYQSAAEKSQAASSVIGSSWQQYMWARHFHFAAAAQYRMACDCLEKRKYGEEIGRLQDAVASLAEGLRRTRAGGSSSSSPSIPATITQDLQNLKSKIEGDLQRATKDNDVIYLDTVPAKSELKAIERATMAAPRCPDAVARSSEHIGSDEAEFGRALFAKLVPFTVHLSMSLYEDRRNRETQQYILQPLEELSDVMSATLSRLGLPGGLQAVEKPLGLPAAVTQQADELRQADAVTRVQTSFEQIDSLRETDWTIFRQGVELLDEEVKQYHQYQRQYGSARWPQRPSDEDEQGKKLWENVEEIQGYFSSSESSDEVVREKFRSILPMLELLTGPERALLDFVPASRRVELAEPLKVAIGRLRSVYNDIQRLQSRRRKRTEAIKDKIAQDQVQADCLKEAARMERTYPAGTALTTSHFEEFIEKRVSRLYDGDMEQVKREQQEQEKLLADATRLTREFDVQKRRVLDDATVRDREAKLQQLHDAYAKYGEILDHIEAGIYFYNNLGRIVGPMFRDRVEAWVAQRQQEAQEFEGELSLSDTVQGLQIGSHPSHHPSQTGSQPDQQSQSHRQRPIHLQPPVPERPSSYDVSPLSPNHHHPITAAGPLSMPSSFSSLRSAASAQEEARVLRDEADRASLSYQQQQHEQGQASEEHHHAPLHRSSHVGPQDSLSPGPQNNPHENTPALPRKPSQKARTKPSTPSDPLAPFAPIHSWQSSQPQPQPQHHHPPLPSPQAQPPQTQQTQPHDHPSHQRQEPPRPNLLPLVPHSSRPQPPSNQPPLNQPPPQPPQPPTQPPQHQQQHQHQHQHQHQQQPAPGSQSTTFPPTNGSIPFATTGPSSSSSASTRPSLTPSSSLAALAEQTTWTPSMNIRFHGPAAGAQGQGQGQGHGHGGGGGREGGPMTRTGMPPAPGPPRAPSPEKTHTWDPRAGIKFG